MLNRKILAVLMSLLLAGPALAASDPTRPPNAVDKVESEQAVASKAIAIVAPKPVKAKPRPKPKPLEAISSYKLGALVHSDGKQTAYVNNQLHKVGDKLGSYKISVIDTDHIHLRHGRSEWRIDLYQRILKIK